MVGHQQLNITENLHKSPSLPPSPLYTVRNTLKLLNEYKTTREKAGGSSLCQKMWLPVSLRAVQPLPVLGRWPSKMFVLLDASLPLLHPREGRAGSAPCRAPRLSFSISLKEHLGNIPMTLAPQLQFSSCTPHICSRVLSSLGGANLCPRGQRVTRPHPGCSAWAGCALLLAQGNDTQPHERSSSSPISVSEGRNAQINAEEEAQQE